MSFIDLNNTGTSNVDLIGGGTDVSLRGEDGVDRLAVRQGGPVEVLTGSLRLPTGSAVEDGAGTERVEVGTGTVLSGDDGTNRLAVRSGGPVEVVAGDLRLPTGNAIEDGSGNGRLTVSPNQKTALGGGAGDVFVAEDGFGHRVRVNANTGRFFVRDTEGGFDAWEYSTSASAPGTLDLLDTKLDFAVMGTETNDGMTANPESDTEDAFVTVSIEGTDYQIPAYSP